MDRSRRLYDLWSWFVPFRTVAETESLPHAAQHLHVAPSALSRSVRLLEDRLGIALFERRSQRLVLNGAGQRLLTAVRTAMRLIDDGLDEALGERCQRMVRIACYGELLPLVSAALGFRTGQGDGIAVTIDEPCDVDVAGALLRGTIDIAVVSTQPETSGVTVRHVGSLARGVFIQPTFGGISATRRDLRYAVVVEPNGAARDGFCELSPRTTGLRSQSGAAVLEAVRSGGLAAVLPRIVGRTLGFVEEPVEATLAPLELTVLTRHAVASADVACEVAGELVTALTAVLGRDVVEPCGSYRSGRNERVSLKAHD